MTPLKLTIPIAPVPASRARVTRFGTYYGKRYKAFMAKMSEWVSENRTLIGPPSKRKKWLIFRNTITVRIDLFCRTPKKPANCYPTGDVDNYAKGVLDSFNGVLWEDDSQIVELTVTKCYSDDPRIEMEIS